MHLLRRASFGCSSARGSSKLHTADPPAAATPRQAAAAAASATRGTLGLAEASAPPSELPANIPPPPFKDIDDTINLESALTVPVLMGREKSIGVGLNSDNIVTSVMEGSAGARAGLRLGDIVLGWQGHPLEGRRLQDVLRPAHVHILSIARVGALYAAQSRDSSGRAAAAPSCVDEDEETPLNEAARPAAPPLSRRDTARYDEIRRDTAAAAAAAAAATRGDALMPPKREACGSQHAKGRSAAVSASVSAAVRRPNIEAEAAHRSVAAFEQARIAKRSDAWAGESQEEEVMGVWAGAYNGDLAVSRKEEASEREEEEEEGEEKEGEEAVDEESAAIAMFDAAAAMFGVAANGLGAPSRAPRAGVGGDATEGRHAKMDPEERAAVDAERARQKELMRRLEMQKVALFEAQREVEATAKAGILPHYGKIAAANDERRQRAARSGGSHFGHSSAAYAKERAAQAERIRQQEEERAKAKEEFERFDRRQYEAPPVEPPVKQHARRRDVHADGGGVSAHDHGLGQGRGHGRGNTDTSAKGYGAASAHGGAYAGLTGYGGGLEPDPEDKIGVPSWMMAAEEEEEDDEDEQGEQGSAQAQEHARALAMARQWATTREIVAKHTAPLPGRVADGASGGGGGGGGGRRKGRDGEVAAPTRPSASAAAGAGGSYLAEEDEAVRRERLQRAQRHMAERQQRAAPGAHAPAMCPRELEDASRMASLPLPIAERPPLELGRVAASGYPPTIPSVSHGGVNGAPSTPLHIRSIHAANAAAAISAAASSAAAVAHETPGAAAAADGPPTLTRAMSLSEVASLERDVTAAKTEYERLYRTLQRSVGRALTEAEAREHAGLVGLWTRYQRDAKSLRHVQRVMADMSMPGVTPPSPSNVAAIEPYLPAAASFRAYADVGTHTDTSAVARNVFSGVGASPPKRTPQAGRVTDGGSGGGGGGGRWRAEREGEMAPKPSASAAGGGSGSQLTGGVARGRHAGSLSYGDQHSGRGGGRDEGGVSYDAEEEEEAVRREQLHGAQRRMVERQQRATQLNGSAQVAEARPQATEERPQRRSARIGGGADGGAAAAVRAPSNAPRAEELEAYRMRMGAVSSAERAMAVESASSERAMAVENVDVVSGGAEPTNSTSAKHTAGARPLIPTLPLVSASHAAAAARANPRTHVMVHGGMQYDAAALRQDAQGNASAPGVDDAEQHGASARDAAALNLTQGGRGYGSGGSVADFSREAREAREASPRRRAAAAAGREPGLLSRLGHSIDSGLEGISSQLSETPRVLQSKLSQAAASLTEALPAPLTSIWQMLPPNPLATAPPAADAPSAGATELSGRAGARAARLARNGAPLDRFGQGAGRFHPAPAAAAAAAAGATTRPMRRWTTSTTSGGDDDRPMSITLADIPDRYDSKEHQFHFC